MQVGEGQVSISGYLIWYQVNVMAFERQTLHPFLLRPFMSMLIYTGFH